ncbi:Beta-barrel assembly machine subunit BamA [Filimonas lacunae]|uniref:Beta-barrel assembly machine subunit BamA n=2 Tax=Filimonas lacunae TaxID=477680 RepID=A0A173MQC9_9BACT|nr:outer membrane protein assembly factor YaeT precursor [Filimonas lacunae]SIS80495.1 Beta-barrel assembly machine subunit BamA [Filimonas lacunae]
MRTACKSFILVVVACLGTRFAMAQVPEKTPDSTGQITSIDADLMNLLNQKTPKKYKVASIKVTGNKFFDESLLLSIAGINIGDEISIPGGDNFSKAITKLWAQNYFSDVEIYITKLSGKEIELEIAVTERPRLSKFYFKGAKKSEQDDLKSKTGLIIGRVITENMKISAIEAIKKYYYEKAYRNITVKINEVKDPSADNYQLLYFMINKANKVKINDINFVGNQIDELKLKKQLKGTKEMSRFTLNPPVDTSGWYDPKKYTFEEYVKEWGFLVPSKTKKVLDPYVRVKLFSSAKFNDKKYDEDKTNIIDYYNSLGYRDAVIDKDTFYYNANGNMNINIRVSEGHKYFFGNIYWRGNTKYSDSVLSQILGIQKGDIYNAEILNKKLGKSASPEGGDISGLYMDDGYLFFRTDPVETAVYNDTIDFEIRLVEGPQATIDKITIAGNDKTKEHVIRRELRTIPGEKFSRTDLIRSQREIANLGYFNQEKIGINPVPNPDKGTVDINYTLEEKSSDQLELSAGFGGGIGLTGTLGVTFNNFSARNIFSRKAWDPLPTGDGQKLSLRVQSNGRAYRSYNISFTEPWLGGKKRNAFTIGLFDTKYSNAYNYLTGRYEKAAGDTSYFRTTGASVGLAKQLKWPDDYFSLGFTLSYARYKLRNYPIDANLTLKDGNVWRNGHSNNLSLKIALQRSSVDQPIFPRSGSNFLLSLQATPPYSLINKDIVNETNPYKWVEYHKWRFSGEWYVPLGQPHGAERNKQFVLKAAAKYGFIGKYNSDLQVSPFERFQVGDAGLSNTYALLGYDIISQRGYPVYESSDPTVNPDQQGASKYFTMFNKYVLELRYPLSLNPSSTIYGLTFFEAANGWYSFKDYNPFRLRRSVGVGMRFFLPMFGLLGFDYGIGLDRTTPGNGLKGASRFTFMLGFEPE